MTQPNAKLVEVARAIDPRAFEPGFHSIGELGDIKRRFAINRAKEAIRALMEPSEDMVFVGEAMADFILPSCFDNTPEGRQAEMRMAYKTMLAKVLEEEG